MFAASSRGVASPQRSDVSGGLATAIAAKQQHNAAMAEELQRVREQLDVARGALDPSAELATVNQQLDVLSSEVGLTQVSGPGVTVTLWDAQPPDPLPEDLTADDFVVHQQDIQAVVNALWRGGAAGITVMDHRLVSTSAVRCVGNTVILDGRVYSPPFVIAAVGPVQNLLRSLRSDDTVAAYRAWAAEAGLGYAQRTDGNLRLPEYRGPLGLSPDPGAADAPAATGSLGEAAGTGPSISGSALAAGVVQGAVPR